MKFRVREITEYIIDAESEGDAQRQYLEGYEDWDADFDYVEFELYSTD